jgi:hypothetical protein
MIMARMAPIFTTANVPNVRAVRADLSLTMHSGLPADQTRSVVEPIVDDPQTEVLAHFNYVSRFRFGSARGRVVASNLFPNSEGLNFSRTLNSINDISRRRRSRDNRLGSDILLFRFYFADAASRAD